MDAHKRTFVMVEFETEAHATATIVEHSFAIAGVKVLAKTRVMGALTRHARP